MTTEAIQEARAEIVAEILHHLKWCDAQDPGSSIESMSAIRSAVYRHLTDLMPTSAGPA